MEDDAVAELRDDAETVLRRRFANGEIEEEEYHKRLETVKK